MVRIPAHIASPPAAMANPAPMNIEEFRLHGARSHRQAASCLATRNKAPGQVWQ